ncbi:MAG TPA: aliphatic sulfonate ABC transporter substrate-binding protein, partial [Candidatus Acidoferrales bacterium]|nr:aliphatic sulfonate ABC transporter substrate-binding protein [Candidatus Acidoferrales bacterium]
RINLKATTVHRALLLAAILLAAGCGVRAQQKPLMIHVGYFPNITHAQALVGRAGGQFEKALGTGVQIEWKPFNAGPAAVEALFAGAIDITYIGPNPAVMGYVRSEGDAVRLIAGAASGGAALVVRKGAGIETISDFHGKKIATPQQGNSQDVALRAWLHANSMHTKDKGGDVQVLPVNNAYQYTLFLKGELDAAWSPEPWASRLIHEAGARMFLDERDKWPNHEFASTVLIVRPKFLKEHPDLVKNFVRAHVELTDWINSNPDEAKLIVNAQLKKETGKPLKQAVLDDAFARIKVTYDPIRSSLVTSTQQAFEAGFLGHKQPDISGLYDLTLLNEVLREKKAQPLQ